MEILIALLLLVICIIKILIQRKALERYAKSTKLFTQAVDQYQESVDGYQRAVDGYQQIIEVLKQDISKYELLLKEHGIEKSKSKDEATQSPIPPPQFNLHKHPQSKTTQTDFSSKRNPLPNLKPINCQSSKTKGVSKNNPRYKELLKLLNGNEETANRLITHQQQLNPNRLEDWILEKVVVDLKRDRRI
ncbi:hypothetical protein BV378_07650 [Nostoc sp. RF31YmG]|nr:hypothetical protein BV378_07650 [Nostoc sp. RF31YmG]